MKRIFEKIFDCMDKHRVLTAPITSLVILMFFGCAIISIVIGKPIVDVDY